MKLAILTTRTTHHLRFAQELARRVPVAGIIVEQAGRLVTPPHPLEANQIAHENKLWFGGRVPEFHEFAPVKEVANINDAVAARALREWRPTLTIVFGTKKILSPLIELLAGSLLNLHGGDPEYYRGLDSHLWTIYHRDFDLLVTTLHRVSPDLDKGDIVLKATLPLRPGMKLNELRSVNTEACVNLAFAAIGMMEKSGRIISWPQRQAGRYYSAMPLELKEACLQAFEKHTAKL